MKLSELVNKYNFYDIGKTIIDLYPDQKENIDGYREALDWLQQNESDDSEFTISIEKVIDDYDGQLYHSVTGFKSNDVTPYALVFTDWSEWLGMDISDLTLSSYSEREIIAHCLYEMTFFGYSNDEIFNKSQELFGKYDSYRQ